MKNVFLRELLELLHRYNLNAPVMIKVGNNLYSITGVTDSSKYGILIDVEEKILNTSLRELLEHLHYQDLDSIIRVRIGEKLLSIVGVTNSTKNAIVIETAE